MNKATAKALIVATAKAHGVKSPSSELTAEIGKLRGQALSLQKRGQRKLVPISQVYRREDFYQLGQAARKLMDRAQNLPEGSNQLSTLVQRSLYQVQKATSYAIQHFDNPKRDADDAAFTFEKCGMSLSDALDYIKRYS